MRLSMHVSLLIQYLSVKLELGGLRHFIESRLSPLIFLKVQEGKDMLKLTFIDTIFVGEARTGWSQTVYPPFFFFERCWRVRIYTSLHLLIQYLWVKPELGGPRQFIVFRLSIPSPLFQGYMFDGMDIDRSQTYWYVSDLTRSRDCKKYSPYEILVTRMGESWTHYLWLGLVIFCKKNTRNVLVYRG